MRTSSRAERGAEAQVRSLAECEVELGVGAVDAELVALVEVRGVVVGRREAHHDAPAGRDRDAADLGVDLGHAPVVEDRPVEAQDLLDRVRDRATGRSMIVCHWSRLRSSAKIPLPIVLHVVSWPASAIEYTMFTMSNSLTRSGLPSA